MNVLVCACLDHGVSETRSNKCLCLLYHDFVDGKQKSRCLTELMRKSRSDCRNHPTISNEGCIQVIISPDHNDDNRYNDFSRLIHVLNSVPLRSDDFFQNFRTSRQPVGPPRTGTLIQAVD